jgi:hypothetical protein
MVLLLMPSRRSLLKKTASGTIGLAALKVFGSEEIRES